MLQDARRSGHLIDPAGRPGRRSRVTKALGDRRDQSGKPSPTGSGGGERKRLKLLAVTACPTGIAHTYMAAEKLAQAAVSRGIDMKVETQGSIGAENILDDNDVTSADGIIIAADKDVDLSRFAGKRVLTVGVAEGIRHPEQLIERVQSAPVHMEGGSPTAARATGGKERGITYKALMNGVSYMIPFVVVGGLLIAVSLAIGGNTTPDGLVIPEDSFWMDVNNIGVIGFTLMVPILSGYIAYAIGDRPALVPGMIGGWIANTGELYDSKAGAGFIGAIVTGFLAGYLVLWIKKVKVPKFVQPIMPIIVIPIVATSALGLFFIYVIGKPISWVFEHLTSWLSGMTGTSAILLGAILGLMIAFDMGGPVNKTAFLFGAGLIATGNQTVMGMCAAAIPVMPLGQGLATLIRKRLYTEQERETGLASLFMGCFGISEGAIPFAAARPAQVIPANMLGGAVAGAIAGLMRRRGRGAARWAHRGRAGCGERRADVLRGRCDRLCRHRADDGRPRRHHRAEAGHAGRRCGRERARALAGRGGRGSAGRHERRRGAGRRQSRTVASCRACIRGAGRGRGERWRTRRDRGCAGHGYDGGGSGICGAGLCRGHREPELHPGVSHPRSPLRSPHRADREGSARRLRQGDGDPRDGGPAGADGQGGGRRRVGGDGVAA